MVQQKRIQGTMRFWGSIPGLDQWLKDPALPRAVVQVADTARTWHCCLRGTDDSICSYHYTLNLVTSICHLCSLLKTPNPNNQKKTFNDSWSSVTSTSVHTLYHTH